MASLMVRFDGLNERELHFEKNYVDQRTRSKSQEERLFGSGMSGASRLAAMSLLMSAI